MNGRWPYSVDEMREKFKLPRLQSGKDADAFISALAAMPSFEREKAMDELRERVCILCGALDPDCPCWESIQWESLQ